MSHFYMNYYLPRYLGIYAALVALVWIPMAQTGLFTTATVLLPALVGALVGRWFVKDESRVPTRQERLTFATLATLLGEVVYLAVLTGGAYLVTRNVGLSFEWPGMVSAPAFWLYQTLPTMIVTWPLVYFGTFLGAHHAAEKRSSLQGAHQQLEAEQQP